MTIILQLILLFFFNYALCQNYQISDGLSLAEINDSVKWFQIQAGNPYVRKFVLNDDIVQAQKINKKNKVNVLEGLFIAQPQDPKEDLMISVNGSQFQGRKPSIFIQYQLENQGYLCGEGSTICFIEKDVIQKKQKIYIIIQCSDSCEFEILVQYQISKEIIQSQKQLVSMNFREYIKKLYFMLNLGSAKIKGFILKVVIDSDLEGTFDMYIFQGSKYQSINDALQNTQVTSSFGKIIRIEPDQGLTSLQDYTLVLRSQQNIKFMITVDYIYYKEEIDITLNNKFSYALNENEQVLLKANCGDSSNLKSSVSIDLQVHQGEGEIYIDSTPKSQIEQYRFQNSVSSYQTYTLDKKYFVQKNTKEPHFYTLIKASSNFSFTIKIYLSDLKQKKSLDLNNLQYLMFQPSSELKYITYDLQFNLTKQIQIQLILQDLNLKAKKPGSIKSLEMIVKNCEESVKTKQKCKITPEEISNYSKNNFTDTQFIPIIQSIDGYTTKCTLTTNDYQYNQTSETRRKTNRYYSIAIAIAQSEFKNNNLTMFSLQTIKQYTLDKISQFNDEEQQINNFQKKFYYFRVKNQFIEPLKKSITIYVQTQYGCIDVETSLDNLLTSDSEAMTFYSSQPVVKSSRYQQVSQTSSIIDEYYNQFSLDIDGDSYKDVFISVKGKSDSIYKFFIYSQEQSSPTFGNLRAIGDNLDYGRVYEDKLYDVSTMNTLNMYFPQNTSNIFIYYFIDYTDLNIERVKKDIKVMSHLKQRKNIKITPTIKLTDLQTGSLVQQDQYKVLEINDGLIYIETKNKKQQYYQLDILNNYSTNYNISIYYSILYTQSNYYYLKPGFKYYFTADDKAPSQIAFFYARANTTIYFQLFACNGTFTFKQWSQKKKNFSQNINFTLENLQNLSIFIDKSDYYYFQFDLMKPQEQGQVILNLHMYYQDEYSPYDLIQVPDIQYQVKQDNDFLNIKFNYLALNKSVVENLSEQIFTESLPSIQDNTTQSQKQQYILDFANTKALKKQMSDFSSVKVIYYFQISNNQSHISYCNPCFSVPRTYHSFYIMQKRSFANSIEEINNFKIQKADILKAIKKYNPLQIFSIEDSIKNSTISTELYFSVMAALEIKDNLGQLSESYYYLYDRQKINLTYFNQTQVQSNLKEQQQIKTFHLALIICIIVFISLLLISIICSYRIFRKGINLPCSCFMQQVYTDIPDSDSQSKKIKVRRLSNLNNLDGAFNQKVRESIQEFLDVKKKTHKSFTSPPPPTIEQ
ncbi:transmembrane protein, putative (macronuclear) [Tetrahymena thermophila SB210]|uniref:Transmembrane protein, putative n=1 Tax=Tetrahymena thermophila (strain SB210) TaxID=312017 RepID=Q22XS2_TETTS|nr:transmembrane protein, putative [Tetrahymena thermophila SB210]EAR90099.2 transmembrane protein, putative [Tetrahymena thermophila SB210]|eukprot:XP_001010344.2 transmembrane protein, putative [Tetrahymena thermophila SB210]